MDAATFRRDRWLRTSAYHLATWSLAAFVLDLRFRTGGDASGEVGGAVAVVVVAGASFLSSMTHERRIAKMAGPAGEPVFAGAGRMWTVVFAALGAATVALIAASRPELLVPVWLVGAGYGFASWGRAAAFDWYLRLGMAMVAIGIADAFLLQTGGPVGPFRVLVLGLLLPAAALMTNRRFVWFRPEA